MSCSIAPFTPQSVAECEHPTSPGGITVIYRGIQLCAAIALLAVWFVPLPADEKPVSKPFDDSQFVMKAASGGMHEVELGRIATTHAKNEDVKRFGQLMVDDHTKANDDLKKTAQTAGISVPTKMDEECQKEVDRFKNYKGDNFDRDYVKHMVEDHQKDVTEFTQASKEAKNPAIKDFAARTLPVVQGHLDKAKKLQERVK
jgi:putative membrane protein